MDPTMEQEGRQWNFSTVSCTNPYLELMNLYCIVDDEKSDDAVKKWTLQLFNLY